MRQEKLERQSQERSTKIGTSWNDGRGRVSGGRQMSGVGVCSPVLMRLNQGQAQLL